MIDSELTTSTTGASSTQIAIVTAWRRLSSWPLAGSLIAITRARAPSSVLPITAQRSSSTSSSRKKLASSSTSRVALLSTISRARCRIVAGTIITAVATMADLDALALALPQTTKELSDDGRPAYRVHDKLFCVHRGLRPDALDPET